MSVLACGCHSAQPCGWLVVRVNLDGRLPNDRWPVEFGVEDIAEVRDELKRLAAHDSLEADSRSELLRAILADLLEQLSGHAH